MGEEGEIRRTYDMRTSIVHNSNNYFMDDVDVPNDLERALNAINTLHKSLYEIELKHRFGDLIA